MQGVRRVVVTTLVENSVDMLLADGPNVTRAGLAHHFDPKRQNPIAENGLALHVLLEWDRYRYQILFDTGMSGMALLHNAAALGIDLQQIDHLVVSHGHPDHYGGLLTLLEHREAPLPISMHDQAFTPRYLRLASGQLAPYYNHGLTRQGIEARGGCVVSHDDALEVGPGALATGCIPRRVSFEAPPQDISTPNALIQVSEGRMCPDAVPDDQALVIQVGEGIVVLTGCSHAGVINTVRRAVELTGRDHVLGVFGGFHLGFPGTPESKTEATIEEFRQIDVGMLCPMHCTGMVAAMRIRSAFPDRFLLNCTGASVVIEA
ncbi:MAG TPA: MBL fold metallo-hydrolase [Candidatus Dormibacteraeota bacterium]|nr:MBL fold metallo-hydrolase [Candidatus Dormibacteraeota bacterium]